ncbi:MAG TPA: hypothetical protein VGK96_26875, partial [Candidatus Sulfotelmatobacter sp.]
NIGGSLGFARLASYMCPGRVPIGHSLTPSRLRSGYDPDALPRVPMPSTRAELMVTLARFAVRWVFRSMRIDIPLRCELGFRAEGNGIPLAWE